MTRAVVTITDQDSTPGTVDVKIVFTPTLKAKEPLPESAQVALGMVEAWMKLHGRQTGDTLVNGKKFDIDPDQPLVLRKPRIKV